MSLRSHVTKDLRLLVRDAKGLLIALLLPLVIVGAYSFLNLRDIAAAGRNPDAFILVLSTAFPVLLVASGALVAERRAGTFQRLARTPANMLSLVLAKSLAALVVLGLQVAIIVLVSVWALDGRVLVAPVGLALVLLATGFAAHGLGTFLSACVSTETQASQLTAMLLLLMLTLSGFLQPLEQLGEVGRVAAYAPVALGYSIATEVLAGLGGLENLVFVIGTGLLFLGAAGAVSLWRT